MKHFYLAWLVIFTGGLCSLTLKRDEEPDESLKTLAAVFTAKFELLSGNYSFTAFNLKHVKIPESIFPPSVYTMLVEEIDEDVVERISLSTLYIENNTLTSNTYFFKKSWRNLHFNYDSDAGASLSEESIAKLTLENLTKRKNCTITYQALQDTNYKPDYTRCLMAKEHDLNINCTHIVSRIVENGRLSILARVHNNVVSPDWDPDQHPCSY